MTDTQSKLDEIIADIKAAAARCGKLPHGDPYMRPDSDDLMEWADRLAALKAAQPAADEPVAFWLAVRSGGAEEIFGVSADDANGGKVARALVNEFINDQKHPGQWHLVPVYTRPQPALDVAAVREAFEDTYKADFTDPAMASEVRWFSDGWKAALAALEKK